MKIVLTPIVPKLNWTPAQIDTVLNKALDKTVKLVKGDLEATTRTWQHKVEFKVTPARVRDTLGIDVQTDDKVYGYVTYGTKPHLIRAKGGGLLRFRTGFIPKTRVGIIGSQSGGAQGDVAFAAEVHHPGTKARNFHIVIAKRRKTTLQQEISQGFAKLLRKRG